MADLRPVFFLHISSAGGSSVCRWAQEQPCARVPACGANCNLNCNHPWDWRNACPGPPTCVPPTPICRPGFRPGCQNLARYVSRRNLSFVASETMLPHAPCFGYFKYITILRDPVSRLRSQLERLSAGRPNARLQAILGRRRDFNTSEKTSLMGTAAVNNYLTRLLLGPPAFFLPLRAINASHYAAAAAILASFTAAIPIENLTSHSHLLGRALGWAGAPPRTNTHHTSKLRLTGRRLGVRPANAGPRAERKASRLTAGGDATPLRERPAGRGAAAGGRPMQAAGRAPRPNMLGERSLRLLRELNIHDAMLVDGARRRFEAHAAADAAEERARGARAGTGLAAAAQHMARGGGSAPRCQRRQCAAGVKVNYHLGADVTT